MDLKDLNKWKFLLKKMPQIRNKNGRFVNLINSLSPIFLRYILYHENFTLVQVVDWDYYSD